MGSGFISRSDDVPDPVCKADPRPTGDGQPYLDTRPTGDGQPYLDTRPTGDGQPYLDPS